MLLREVFFVPGAEFKFAGDGEPGLFTGYASVIGIIDSHRDMVMPNAFKRSLSEYKTAGKLPTMYIQHEQANPFIAARPAGKWLDIVEDGVGLRVKGQLGMLDCEKGRENYAMLREGLLPALSIAYNVPDGGAIHGKKPGDPRRQLYDVNLVSVDIVDQPSNPMALIDSVKAACIEELKAMAAMPNTMAAADSIVAAHAMCTDCLSGGNAPTRDQRGQIFQHLQDAHKALTGQDIPAAMKMAFDQLRELKRWLHRSRDEGGRGFSDSQADEIAELVFKSTPRDEDSDAAANAARKEAVGAIRSLLTGFSLKSPGE